MKFKVKLYFPATSQDGVYDYEGWAHSRGSFTVEHLLEGTIDSVHEFLRNKYHEWGYGISIAQSPIVGENSIEYPFDFKKL